MNPRERSVIARLLSGLVIRGNVLDFTPDRPAFRVTPDGEGRGVEVRIRDLKALFFPRIDEPNGAAPAPSRGYGSGPDPVKDGKRVTVVFKDGERMTGFTLTSFKPDRIGFYLYPDDPDTQHEKLFVHSAAVAEVTPLAADAPPTVRAPRREAA